MKIPPKRMSFSTSILESDRTWSVWFFGGLVGLSCLQNQKKWMSLITFNDVLCSAWIGLIFTEAGRADPNQPIKWDILYHGMSRSVFKSGAGSRKGIYYSRASWALGGEKIACCTIFLSILLLFSSPFVILL